MKQEIREEIFEELKVMLAKVLGLIEETAGIKVGRDAASRQEHIAQGAGALYGKVIEEAKTMVENYVAWAKAQVAKFH